MRMWVSWIMVEMVLFGWIRGIKAGNTEGQIGA